MGWVWRKSAAVIAMAAAAVSGCSHGQKAQPLTPTVFVGSGRTDRDANIDPLSRADQPGQLYNNVHAEQVPSDKREATPPVEGLSKTVQENVRAPGAEAADMTSPPTPAPAPRTTAPTTTTQGASSGQYLTLGGVVMDVNGTPIYANRVIALAEPVLAARAKDLDQNQFRAIAQKELGGEIRALRDLQLEYAAAERNLDQKDKDLADQLTMQWRQKQITAAGGSEEVARRRFAERGEDFDDLLQQQYRVWMSRIYYEKKLMPQVQVGANDMRAFYDQNRDRLFTDHGAARFRLIKIAFDKHGGRDGAWQTVNELRNRITKAGESFESIAHSANDDPRWLASGGDIGAAIQQGAFAIEPVERAVWQTPVGQVTPVVEAGNAFYIAKVEELKTGRVRPFEDEQVQTEIMDRLRAEQFNALRQKVQQALIDQAVIRSDPEMMNVVLDMAMQNYPRWAGK
jgi:parvulin-like peptidyl-prolyl isomerase